MRFTKPKNSDLIYAFICLFIYLLQSNNVFHITCSLSLLKTAYKILLCYFWRKFPSLVNVIWPLNKRKMQIKCLMEEALGLEWFNKYNEKCCLINGQVRKYIIAMRKWLTIYWCNWSSVDHQECKWKQSFDHVGKDHNGKPVRFLSSQTVPSHY